MATSSATPTSSKRQKDADKGGSAIIAVYLIAYNVSQMLGWLALLVIIINDIISKKSADKVYFAAAPILKICQTAAVLEIFHSLTGMVRSNWILTAFQVYSRVFLLWGVVWSVPETQVGIHVAMFLFAWTITEIIRYSFYFFNLLPGAVPYGLIWCRYTFFIVLYPIGVTGELLAFYSALPTVKKTGMYGMALPNQYNISFNYYYFLIAIMISYIPIFPQLYLHMFSQRRKVVGGGAASRPKRD